MVGVYGLNGPSTHAPSGEVEAERRWSGPLSPVITSMAVARAIFAASCTARESGPV